MSKHRKKRRLIFKKPLFPHWKIKLQKIIFQSDSLAGKFFDFGLITLILTSVGLIMLESIAFINILYKDLIFYLEWFFTILFTIEYILRLLCLRYPKHYAKSFFGCVDLLAVLPTYFSLLVPETHFMGIIRLLRVLLIFRILKLAHYVDQAQVLLESFKASKQKIIVFFFFVFNLVVLFGSFMYVIESNQPGFSNIPQSIYWAIVTLTTVGYGDITPHTPFGKLVASMIMILGYSIIAVPTGLVAVELNKNKDHLLYKICSSCSYHNSGDKNKFCSNCGQQLI